MSCLELPRVQAWLDQFHYLDRAFAEQLLCKVRYVSFEDFEENLARCLLAVLDQADAETNTKGRIAVFPVTKPPSDWSKTRDEIKVDNDSSGRVGHALKNIERALEDRFELSARVDSMRAKRVRDVIFVDDFIGTGTRFTRFWQNDVSASIKSWASLGLVKIWVVSYAAHGVGISRIASYVNSLATESVRCHIPIGLSFIVAQREFATLVRKYGALLLKDKAAEGYGGILSPIIFQHGCPNNAPGIFWDRGRKLSARQRREGYIRWEPLFPNRSIPTELYPLFSEDLSAEALPEDIWNIAQYNLALEFLSKLDMFGDGQVTLAILAYLDKKIDVEKIKINQVMTDEEIGKEIDGLRQYGLIDDENVVTRFGKDVILRTKKPRRADIEVPGENYQYYPQSFLGFHREP